MKIKNNILYLGIFLGVAFLMGGIILLEVGVSEKKNLEIKKDDKGVKVSKEEYNDYDWRSKEDIEKEDSNQSDDLACEGIPEKGMNSDDKEVFIYSTRCFSEYPCSPLAKEKTNYYIRTLDGDFNKKVSFPNKESASDIRTFESAEDGSGFYAFETDSVSEIVLNKYFINKEGAVEEIEVLKEKESGREERSKSFENFVSPNKKKEARYVYSKENPDVRKDEIEIIYTDSGAVESYDFSEYFETENISTGQQRFVFGGWREGSKYFYVVNYFNSPHKKEPLAWKVNTDTKEIEPFYNKREKTLVPNTIKPFNASEESIIYNDRLWFLDNGEMGFPEKEGNETKIFTMNVENGEMEEVSQEIGLVSSPFLSTSNGKRLYYIIQYEMKYIDDEPYWREDLKYINLEDKSSHIAFSGNPDISFSFSILDSYITLTQEGKEYLVSLDDIDQKIVLGDSIQDKCTAQGKKEYFEDIISWSAQKK